MTKVIYTGPCSVVRVYEGKTKHVLAKGVPTEVPADLAKRLLKDPEYTAAEPAKAAKTDGVSDSKPYSED